MTTQDEKQGGMYHAEKYEGFWNVARTVDGHTEFIICVDMWGEHDDKRWAIYVAQCLSACRGIEPEQVGKMREALQSILDLELSPHKRLRPGFALDVAIRKASEALQCGDDK